MAELDIAPDPAGGGEDGLQPDQPASEAPAGNKQTRRMSLGLSTLKQYMAAAAYLQMLQQTFLFGGMITQKVTQIMAVKADFKLRRSKENARRHANREDMARCEIIPP